MPIIEFITTFLSKSEKKNTPQIRSRYSTQSSSDEKGHFLDDFCLNLNAESNALDEIRKFVREQVENAD